MCFFRKTLERCSILLPNLLTIYGRNEMAPVMQRKFFSYNFSRNSANFPGLFLAEKNMSQLQQNDQRKYFLYMLIFFFRNYLLINILKHRYIQANSRWRVELKHTQACTSYASTVRKSVGNAFSSDLET